MSQYSTPVQPPCPCCGDPLSDRRHYTAPGYNSQHYICHSCAWVRFVRVQVTSNQPAYKEDLRLAKTRELLQMGLGRYGDRVSSGLTSDQPPQTFRVVGARRGELFVFGANRPGGMVETLRAMIPEHAPVRVGNHGDG